MPLLLRRSAWVAVLVVCACVALFATRAAPAHADGDPASDALIYVNVFPTLSFAVRDPRPKALETQAGMAAKAGAPIKLAIVATKQDLGAVPVLFGKPAAYARFLAAEIVYQFVGPLVVIMPQGIAVTPEPPGNAQAIVLTNEAQEKIAKAKIKPGKGASGLLDTAASVITAVSGVPAQTAASGGGSGSGSGSSGSTHKGISAATFLYIVIGVVVLFALVAGYLALHRRRRRFAEDVLRGKQDGP